MWSIALLRVLRALLGLRGGAPAWLEPDTLGPAVDALTRGRVAARLGDPGQRCCLIVADAVEGIVGELTATPEGVAVRAEQLPKVLR